MKYINCYKSSRRLILNALFLFSSALCFSQGYPIKCGIKAGWNYSNINAVDNVGEPSGYLSDGGEIYGGIALEKQFSEKSYIQSGFIASYTYVITFLEIPIFYKYNFYKNFSVFAGPKLDYIPDEQYNHSLYFKKRLGVSANLGIDYKISKHFTLEGYFSKQLVKQYNDNILTFYDAKRNVYRVGVNYYF
ncbi:outer membrane beta-barrel protein [Chryseobacterium chendengshani]|uniref:outer membrane beta-barrel protein n=1 Tax=Chryseobacterium sp. LJ756 TaxID=2864113 RepID=UPI001C63FCA8|nr:outer membrane beta-barrel protein [Chryseobacterium sp. LJ756]MBW7674227.1 porin family protein [Chryseobacterium sp. LJ756]